MTTNWLQNIFDSEGAQELLLSVLEQATDRARGKDCYDSPIELALAVAMCAVQMVRYPDISFFPHRNSTDEERTRRFAWLREPPARKLGIVFPQAMIGPHRVDFLIVHRRGLDGLGGIVVECDGHDFHEKTKQQAARDKTRDRYLQEHGYKVFRYAGSEIWRDAIGCAHQVLSLAYSTAMDAENARVLHACGDVDGAIRELGHQN
jgi:very-short-patch-repair endonuclease